MWENPRPPYPNELYHHGIKGQTWGVTNGPPYPLSQAEHNSVVSEAKSRMKTHFNRAHRGLGLHTKEERAQIKARKERRKMMKKQEKEIERGRKQNLSEAQRMAKTNGYEATSNFSDIQKTIGNVPVRIVVEGRGSDLGKVKAAISSGNKINTNSIKEISSAMNRDLKKEVLTTNKWDGMESRLNGMKLGSLSVWGDSVTATGYAPAGLLTFTYKLGDYKTPTKYISWDD